MLFKILQIMTPTVRHWRKGVRSGSVSASKWKVGSGCRSASKRCRSKIHNTVFPVNMVGDWSQKSLTHICWQCNSDCYLIFSCKQHFEWYILNPDPTISCISCAGHDTKPGQVQDRHNQYCGSGSGLDPDSMGSLDPYPQSGSGSGSRRAKMTQKNIRELTKFIFWSAICSLLRAEGFSCSLDVLYEGLRSV